MTEKKPEVKEEVVILTLEQRLSKIQSELKAPKGQKNKFGNYKYRSCEDILEAIKPLLGGCVLKLTDEPIMLGDRYYIKATATLSFGECEEQTTAYAREPETKKGMDESQITGTASSYARKYALNGLFCIDDTKDADTDSYTETTKETTKKVSKKIPATKKSVARPTKEVYSDAEIEKSLANFKTLKEMTDIYGSLTIAQVEKWKQNFSTIRTKIESATKETEIKSDKDKIEVI